MRVAPLLVLGSAAIAAACSDDYGTNAGACRPTSKQVCMLSTSFSPSTRTVTAGTTVEWIDFSGIAHTVTSSPGSSEVFDNGVGPGLGVFSHQFNAPGTYAYYCRNHGAPTTGMRGTIQVN
jgi:plastocyanin